MHCIFEDKNIKHYCTKTFWNKVCEETLGQCTYTRIIPRNLLQKISWYKVFSFLNCFISAILGRHCHSFSIPLYNVIVLSYLVGIYGLMVTYCDIEQPKEGHPMMRLVKQLHIDIWYFSAWHIKALKGMHLRQRRH